MNQKQETRNQKPNDRRRVWLTRYLPLLVWIGVIFLLSSGQGASTRTSLFIGPLLTFLFPDASSETIVFYHDVVRKLAHFTEYAVLGFLACRAFVLSTGTSFYFFAVGLVVLVAIADETNQSFNPARTGSPVDVLIDVGGGLFGISLFHVSRRRSG